MPYELYLNGKKIPRLCHSKEEVQEVTAKLFGIYDLVAAGEMTVMVKRVKEEASCPSTE